jgi:hypothetical protein
VSEALLRYQIVNFANMKDLQMLAIRESFAMERGDGALWI